MKIGLFADLHLHPFKRFGIDVASGLTRRLKEQCLVIDQMESIFKKEKINLIISAGDILHKAGEVPTECINIAQDFLSNFINKILVAGNHDLVSLDNPQWFHNINNTLDSDHELEYKGIKIVGYTDIVDYDKIKNYDLVVLHKTPIGCRNSSGFEFTDGIDWETLAKNNKMVVFGHIHHRQQLSENCWVLGSPMHLDFGDSGERGCYVYDTVTGVLEFFPLNYPQFITVNSPDQIKKDGNYYRVKGIQAKIDDPNVLSVVEPVYFDERIKADTFEGILKEWLVLNNKDENYYDVVKDIVISESTQSNVFYKGQLARVAISNFLSFGKEVSYTISNGLIVVKGEDSTGKSNGSGKSTLVGEAVLWCLFGETTKGLSGDDVIRNRPTKQKNASVCCVFKLDDEVLKIQRSRKDGLQIFINDKEVAEGFRQPDKQKYLEQSILGFNKSIFLASCYYSQFNTVSLTDMSDTEKTDMITNLLGFEKYDELYTKITAKQSEIVNQIVNIQQQNQEIQNKIKLEETKKQQQTQAIERYSVTNKRSEEQITQLIRDNLELLSKKEETKTIDYDVEINNIEAKRLQCKTEISKIEEDIELGEFQATIRTLSATTGSLNAEKTLILSQVLDLNREIDGVNKAVIGAVCDKCGGIVDEQHKSKYISERKAKADELSIKLKENKEKQTETQTHLIENTEIYNSLVLNLNKLRVMLDESNKQVDNLQKKKFQQQQEVSQREAQQLKIVSLIETNKAKIALIEKQIEENTQVITSLRNESLLFDVAIVGYNQDINNNNEFIAEVQKSSEKYEFWKTAFSSKGIRTVLLDRFCNDFNRIVSEYIANISNGNIQLILTPTKTTKGGEERNKIGIDIVLNGYQTTYLALSGGERTRVDTALCLGLNKWISNRYGIAEGILGFIVCDEIFGFVDSEGEEAIAQQLIQEAQNKAIFVISHTAELSSWADKVWTVKKENEQSEVVCS